MTANALTRRYRAGGPLAGASNTAVGTDAEGLTIISGTVVGGNFPTAKHGAQILLGLTNDANNANLLSGCLSGPVDHIDIDSTVSTATL